MNQKELTDKNPKLKPFAHHGVVFCRVAGNQAVGICPFTWKEEKFYVNMGNGLWDSKICGLKGNTEQFLEAIAQRNTGLIDAEQMKMLVNHRGLPRDAFKHYQVGSDPSKNWYTFPVTNENGTVIDLRTYKLGDRVKSTLGRSPGLLGADDLAAAHKNTPVYLCEGEWDGMAMRWWLKRLKSAGVVVAVPGATVFKETWSKWFKGRDVFLLYDHDDAGMGLHGEQRVDSGEVLATKRLGDARSIHYVNWPEDSPVGYDLRDWVINWALHKRAPRSGFKKLKALFVGDPRVEIEGIQPEYKTSYSEAVPFSTVETVFRKWLFLENTDGIRVSLATAISERLDGDPVWLFLVAPPGGAKTETVMALTECPETFTVSSLTSHSLISGMQFKDGMDPSLIPKLDGKVLVIKDFTAILGLRDHERDDIFGILRDAYDGNCSKVFGNGLIRGYESSFSILAAVTPEIYGIGKQAALGERFLKFRMAANVQHFREDEIILKAIGNINSETGMRDELRDVVSSFMSRKTDKHNLPSIPEKYIRELIAIAKFGARARATVQRNTFRPDIVEGRPSAEIGSRLGKQLVKLVICLALIEDRTAVNEDDMTLLRKIGKDTIPQRTEDILSALWIAHTRSKMLTTREVSFKSSYPVATVQRLLANFLLLDIVRREGAKRYTWGLSDYMLTCIEDAKLYGSADDERKKVLKFRKKDSSRRT